MTKTTLAVKAFIETHSIEPLAYQDLDCAVEAICCSPEFKSLLLSFINSPAFSQELGEEFAAADAIQGLSACRSLRSCLNISLSRFFSLLTELISAFDPVRGAQWSVFADRMHRSNLGSNKLLERLSRSNVGEFYQDLAHRLVVENPHAVYPTSSYRESRGYVVSTADDQTIEAIVSSSTFASIKIVDHCLDLEQTLLRNIYLPLGRCVCLVDQNVDHYYSEEIEHYFHYHGIHLEKLVYRAMEVDKGIYTVERMLGDLKRLGVSRNEPVLIIGGGVLADTAGLACALYHRNTPYVMLSTSIVAGIDAGPSPRTCCDGFGYKNLFGAYHPPCSRLLTGFSSRPCGKGGCATALLKLSKWLWSRMQPYSRILSRRVPI